MIFYFILSVKYYVDNKLIFIFFYRMIKVPPIPPLFMFWLFYQILFFNMKILIPLSFFIFFLIVSLNMSFLFNFII